MLNEKVGMIDFPNLISEYSMGKKSDKCKVVGTFLMTLNFLLLLSEVVKTNLERHF